MGTLPDLPTRHHVVIFPDGASVRVVPGCLVAAPGDEIVFESFGVDVRIFIPEKEIIFKNPSIVPDFVRLSRNSKTEPIIVAEEPVREVYPYAVYCSSEVRTGDINRLFAIGNSDPTIIIRGRDGG